MSAIQFPLAQRKGLMSSTATPSEAVPRDAQAITPIPQPKWVPFGVILGLILVLLTTPMVFAVVTPAPVENKVGLYQRFSLDVEHNSGEAMGGFIAPEGWFEVTSGDPTRDRDTDHQASSYTFVSPDRRDTITVEMRGDVLNPAELLQSQTPIAATLVPSSVLPAQPGIELSALDVDLRAGAGNTQYVSACSPGVPSACLLITSTAQAWFGDPRLSQRQEDGVMLPAVREMLNSLEVFA